MAKLVFDAHACKGCGLCVSACPKKIVALSHEKLNEKGYAPAYCTDEAACILCGFCATICPDIAITIQSSDDRNN